MKAPYTHPIIAAALFCALPITAAVAQSADPLPSWNDGKSKQSILTFVSTVTKEGSPDFVPPAERIATFDNDGTLWAEQPMYIQLLFGLDRIKELAPQHPEWKDKEPFKSVLAGDLKSAFAGGAPSLIELMALFVRHTDGEREWSYDVTPLGRLEKGLEEAKAKGWTVVDMKNDWKVIYPFENRS